jgi:hypothetical protein
MVSDQATNPNDPIDESVVGFQAEDGRSFIISDEYRTMTQWIKSDTHVDLREMQ